MEEKLDKLYKECIEELRTINIDILDKSKYGEIDISFSPRKTKRYGCCIQEDPDKKTKYKEHRIIHYRKYNKHHIQVSKWLMELDDNIIKNTIMHEIIHCFEDCNNHGKEFKYYAKLINEKLGYDIKRLGDKEKDFASSNVAYDISKEIKYNYEISCPKCKITYYRQRLYKNFTKKYVCGICRSKFEVKKL